MEKRKIDYNAYLMDSDTFNKGRTIHERMKTQHRVGLYMGAIKHKGCHPKWEAEYNDRIWKIARFNMNFIAQGNLIEIDESMKAIEEIELLVDVGGTGPFYSVKILPEDCDGEIYLNSGFKDYLSQICFEMVAETDEGEKTVTVYLSSAFLATAKAVYFLHEKKLDEDVDAMHFYEIMSEAMRVVTE